jgi:hypothetical protein
MAVEMELEATLSTWETSAGEASALLLKEICEGVLAVGKGVSSLLCHGVHGVFAVVEALPQLRVGKDLVRLVEQSHLRFRAALVRVCGLRCFTTGDGQEYSSVLNHVYVKFSISTHYAFLMVLASASRETPTIL